MGSEEYRASEAAQLDQCLLQCLNTWDNDNSVACQSVAFDSGASSGTANCRLYSGRHVRDDSAVWLIRSESYDHYEVSEYVEDPSTGYGVCTHEAANKNDWKTVTKCKFAEATGASCSSFSGCKMVAYEQVPDIHWMTAASQPVTVFIKQVPNVNFKASASSKSSTWQGVYGSSSSAISSLTPFTETSLGNCIQKCLSESSGLGWFGFQALNYRSTTNTCTCFDAKQSTAPKNAYSAREVFAQAVLDWTMAADATYVEIHEWEASPRTTPGLCVHKSDYNKDMGVAKWCQAQQWMKDCRKYGDLAPPGKWTTMATFAGVQITVVNPCAFMFFTYSETGTTTWNQMTGRSAGTNKGSSIALGAAASTGACAELCITYPSFTDPCKSADFDAGTCTGWTNPEGTYTGNHVVGAYSGSNTNVYIEPVAFTEDPRASANTNAA